MKRVILIDVCAALLVLLFLYAALMKLMVYPEFVLQLKHSPLLEPYANTIAWLVPLSEIGITILLIIPKGRNIGFSLAFILMLSFTFYIFYVLNYAPYIPCACGGVLNSMNWTTHLIFNIIYSGIALAGILINQNLLLRERTGKAENL